MDIKSSNKKRYQPRISRPSNLVVITLVIVCFIAISFPAQPIQAQESSSETPSGTNLGLEISALVFQPIYFVGKLVIGITKGFLGGVVAVTEEEKKKFREDIYGYWDSPWGFPDAVRGEVKDHLLGAPEDPSFTTELF